MQLRKAIDIVTHALTESASLPLAEVVARIAQGWDVTFILAQTDQGIEIRGGGDGIHPTEYLHALKTLCYFADTAGQPLVQTIPLPDYGVIQQYGYLGFEVVSRDKKAALIRRTPKAPGAEPQPRPQREDYPEGIFYLPTKMIVRYDDPTEVKGDDGWDIDGLLASIKKTGKIKNPIEVGYSVADMMSRDSTTVCAFNGNHRHYCAEKLGFEFMACENSEADDAEPLTKQDILALGGRLA